MSNFVLQASNPRFIRARDEEDESILDALQTVFPLQAEDAYMSWGPIRVAFGYKYTISFLLPDVLEILDRLMQEESGSLEKYFPTQEFPAIWHLQWQGDRVEIRSEWNTPPSETPAALVVYPTLVLDKGAFISEWKQVLGVALNALEQAGYRDTQLRDLAKLREVHSAIRTPGILYR